MGRRLGRGGTAQLEIIAENLGVPEFELGEIAGDALAFEHGGQRRFAVIRQLHQFIEARIIAWLEKSALGDDRRQRVGQGARQ